MFGQNVQMLMKLQHEINKDVVTLMQLSILDFVDIFKKLRDRTNSKVRISTKKKHCRKWDLVLDIL